MRGPGILSRCVTQQESYACMIVLYPCGQKSQTLWKGLVSGLI